MHQSLDSFLQAVISEPLYFSDDLIEECQSNLFFLSLTWLEIDQLSVEDLNQWIQAVVESKRLQLQTQKQRQYPMCFYCWYDSQAQHLRFSLVAAAYQNHLPFGCPIHFADLLTVLHEVLFPTAKKYTDKIWMNEDGSLHPDYFLEVWTTVIP